MQVIRTIIWVLILFGVLLFSFFNWNPVEVTIWDNLVLETKVPALVIISFLLGFLPTWLISRGVIWSLNRKIRSLEIAAKASSVSAAAREAEREEAARQEPVADEAAVENEPAAPVDEVPEQQSALSTDSAADAEVPSNGGTAVDDAPVVEDAPKPEDKSSQP